MPFTSRLGKAHVAQGWRLRTDDGHAYAEIVKNYATRSFGGHTAWTSYDVEHGRRARHMDAPRTRNAAMRSMEAWFHDRAWERWRLLRGAAVLGVVAFGALR